MSTFTPPVDAYWAIGCSWYCQRAFNGGFQQAPDAASQATGAGGAAETAARAIVEPATSASAAATTKVRRGRMRHLLPASGSLGRRPEQGRTDVRMSRYHALQGRLPDGFDRVRIELAGARDQSVRDPGREPQPCGLDQAVAAREANGHAAQER